MGFRRSTKLAIARIEGAKKPIAQKAKHAKKPIAQTENPVKPTEDVQASMLDVQFIQQQKEMILDASAEIMVCSYIYANPKPGEHKYCPNQVSTKFSHIHCFQHAWKDPKSKWPKCKNGKVHPAHKEGIHPSVSPKEFATGLCYFCLKAAERDYTTALRRGDDPSGLEVAGASPLPTTVDNSPGNVPVLQPQIPIVTVSLSDYLTQVAWATQDIGLTSETLTYETLDQAYVCICQAESHDGMYRYRLRAACGFLYSYLQMYC